MPRHVVFVLVVALAAPVAVQAQERILESAERLAAETTLQGGPEFRRSPLRTTIGIAMAAAGVAMMLIEPSQPTQPAPVADTTLITDVQDLIQTQAFLEGVVADVLAIRPQCGLLPASCGAATVVSVENGAIAGIAVSTVGDRTVYAGEFKPFEKPNAGLRYGGAALAVAGAAVAALWSSVPVMRDVSVSPTRGGVAVGSRIGF